MEMTPRLGLPLLIAGQVQKEIFHNEALTLVDLLLAGVVDSGSVSAPPASPLVGRLYLVASAGTSGGFVGHEASLAGWTQSGWRFIAPVEGMRLTERASGSEFAYRNGAWTIGQVRASEVMIGGNKVLGVRGAAVADAAGGSVVDVQARTAIAQILEAIRAHGLIQV